MKQFLILLVVSFTIAQTFAECEHYAAPQTCSDSGSIEPNRARKEKRQSIGDTFQFRNVGASLCMQGGDPRDDTELVEVRECQGTLNLQQFTIENSNRGGVMFSTPWNKGDRCIYTGNQEAALIWSSECNPNCPVFVWEMIKVEGGHLLKHNYSGLCARAEGRYMRLRSCENPDSRLVWQMQK